MCTRTFCKSCGEELIHRDHRKSYESASALGQIIHREGPRELTVGDLDLYAAKWLSANGSRLLLLRLLEHKQTDQPLGIRQQQVLLAIHRIIESAIISPPRGLHLHHDSGVFVIRGPLDPEMEGRRKVDFKGRQIIRRIDGNEIDPQPRTRLEFYDWLNGGPGWTPRAGVGRYGGSLSA